MKSLKITTILTLVITCLMSCQKDQNAPIQQEEIAVLKDHEVPKSALLLKAGKSSQISTSSDSRKRRVQLYKVEYLASGKDSRAGNTVFFNNRGNKQLEEDFVAALSLDGTPDITYHIDRTRPSNDLP